MNFTNSPVERSPVNSSPVERRDRLPLKVRRRTTIDSVPQGVYLGLELDYDTNGGRKANYAICTHDGCYAIDYEFSSVDVSNIPNKQERIEKVIQVVLDNITLYSMAQNYKIQAVGLGAHLISNGKDISKFLFSAPSIASRLWLEFDALPFIFKTKGATADERASKWND